MDERETFNSRLRVMALLMFMVIAVLIGRVGYLQLYEGDYYAGLANGNRIRIIPTVAPRGTFYDRNGVKLVTNRPGFAVSLLPLTGPIPEEVIQRVSQLLQVPETEIHNKLKGHIGVEPVLIKTDVPDKIVTILEEQKELYPGVIIEVQPVRDYIYKSEGVHVMGYVSEISDEELAKRKDDGYKTGDIIGQFGLERYFDRLIRGENGGEQVEVDVDGHPLRILGTKPTVPGDDLYLTIDHNIQEAAEKAVDIQLDLIHAHAAAAVVMNPQTGEILAMVSRPGFDPNLFVKGISDKEWNAINNNPYFPMDNKAITGEYPPGSTFKIVTGVAALSEGVVSPYEYIFDSGVHWVVPKGNADGEALGYLNFEQAMAHSDNVYFYEMGNRLGIDRLEAYGRRFGLGEKTGITLPYESEGLVANQKYKEEVFKDDWYLAETFDAAIGQGFNLVTPLQACMLMSEIAADGKRYRPHIVSKIVSPDGQVVEEFQPELVSTLDVSPSIMSIVQSGLHGVTTYGTAASSFAGFPIAIAGKTGTAENPHGRDHGWFVAYGPFEDPTICVAVIVEQGGYGSASAVPIGRRILEAAFGIAQPQDKKASDKNKPANKAPVQQAVMRSKQ